MRKLVACVAATFSAFAMAAGPYDGLYVNSADPNHFLSIHQNQTTILITALRVLPSTGVALVTPQGSFIPPVNKPWDFFLGPINGASAVVEGVGVYGACAQNLSVQFTGTQALARLNAMAPTAAGAAQGFPCLGAIGAQQVFERIF